MLPLIPFIINHSAEKSVLRNNTGELETMQKLDIAPVPERLMVARSTASSARLKEVGGEIEDASRDAELRKACADFEALFLHKLLKTMRQTVPKSGLIDGGLREEIFTDMLDEKIASAAAHGRGTGLGERIYSDLRRAYGMDAAEITGLYEDNAAVEEDELP